MDDDLVPMDSCARKTSEHTIVAAAIVGAPIAEPIGAACHWRALGDFRDGALPAEYWTSTGSAANPLRRRTPPAHGYVIPGAMAVGCRPVVHRQPGAQRHRV